MSGIEDGNGVLGSAGLKVDRADQTPRR